MPTTDTAVRTSTATPAPKLVVQPTQLGWLRLLPLQLGCTALGTMYAFLFQTIIYRQLLTTKCAGFVHKKFLGVQCRASQRTGLVITRETLQRKQSLSRS
eukprot:SAG31_NODE_3626_length_4055_cov_16.812184_4_plen_100_part_00